MRSQYFKYKKNESAGSQSSQPSRPSRITPLSHFSSPPDVPSPRDGVRSFSSQGVAQSLPSEPLEFVKEWQVWEGTQELALSSYSKILKLDLRQTVLQAAQILKGESQNRQAEVASVRSRLEFLYSSPQSQNIFYVQPDHPLKVLHQYDVSGWKAIPLFKSESRGSYVKLRVSHPEDPYPRLFCIKRAYYESDEDELLVFEHIFDSPVEGKTYQKTLLMKRQGIRDIYLEKGYDPSGDSFVLLVKLSGAYMKIEYQAHEGKVVRRKYYRREEEREQHLMSVNEVVWIGLGELLQCWNVETNELRQVSVSTRREKMRYYITKNLIIMHRDRQLAGSVTLIFLSKEVEVVQRITIDELLSHEVKSAAENGELALVLLDRELITINTTTWAHSKQFLSLTLESFDTSFLLLSEHFNILLGEAENGLTLVRWSPTREYASHHASLNKERLYEVSKTRDSLSLLELSRTTPNQNRIINQFLLERELKWMEVATIRDRPLFWELSKDKFERFLFVEEEEGKRKVQVEIYSSKSDSLKDSAAIVWLKGVSLSLFTSRHSYESLQTLENRYKQEYELGAFLERTVMILSFEPIFTGDAASLFETHALPGSQCLVLRSQSMQECHSHHYSRLFVSQDDMTRMATLTLDAASRTIEAVSYTWVREMEPPEIKGGKIVTVRDRLLVVLIVDQRELRIMDTRTRKGESVYFSRPFDQLYLKDGNLILKANWGSYVLEYVPLKFPFKYELALQFYDGQYLVERGSKGAAIFMPFAQFAGAPTHQVSEMEDYTNNFLFFFSRDYTIQLNEISEFSPKEILTNFQRQSSLLRKLNDSGYSRISGRGPETPRTARPDQQGIRSSFKSTLRQVQKTSRQFYLSVSKCGTNELILMLMHHFTNFQEMNDYLGKKRFMAALATHISTQEAHQFMFLFEPVQNELLHQASKGLLSLKPFYSLAAIKVGEVKIDALTEVNELELPTESMEAFVSKIPRNKDNLTYGLDIYRSAFKVPPSNHPSTHEMSILLYETKDLEVFEAPLMQIFIRERWKGARNYFYCNAILFMISLILLFWHSAFYRDWLILVPLAIIQIWMLLVEVLEMMDKKCGYFMEFWNWFDLSRILLTFVYCAIVAIGSVNQEVQSDFLTMLNLFQTLRTFYIFFIFASMRVLLRIIIEIVKDMSSFFVFVTLSTLLLGMLFTSCIHEDHLTDYTYETLLYQAFLLNFGYFDLKMETGLFRFIFMFGMFLIPLIMMNMLIAIMGDTYGRVREEQSRRDFQELIGLVEKYEVAAKVLCKWKRKKDWTFIFYSQEKMKEGVEQLNEWQGQIKGIKRHIDKIQTKNQHWQDTADQEFRERQDWEKRTEEWQRKVDKQQRKIDAWQRRAQAAQKKTDKNITEVRDESKTRSWSFSEEEEILRYPELHADESPLKH